MKLKQISEKILNSEFITPLCELAKNHKTDKYEHGYTKIYFNLMKDLKSSNVSIFEIGIYLGNSIRLWDSFFENGLICGIDNGRILSGTKINSSNYLNINSSDDEYLLELNSTIDEYDFSWIETNKIKCSICDQRSISQLEKSFIHFGQSMFDFIIDDGQHFQEHQQKSLGILFKNLKSGGFYIIEDVVRVEGLKMCGDNWGQKKEDFSDCTETVFEKFINGGEFYSDYMTREQMEYIINNIDDIFIFNSDNSGLRKNSEVIVIKKK